MNTFQIENKIIVFGGNHHNTLGLVRSMGENGFSVIVFLEPCNLNFCNLRFSKYIVKLHFLSTMNNALDVLRSEYWNEKDKPIILCGSDASISLLDAHYNKLKNHFFIFNINGQQGRINAMMNKLNTFPIAKKNGLSTIRTWQVSDIRNLPEDIIFPCLTKGINSNTSSKDDIFVCKNRKDLEICLRDGVDYIIQEYIEKDYEIDIVGFAYNHGKDIFVPGVVRKIRDEIHHQSDYIRLDDLSAYPLINIEIIRQFITDIGYEGIFSIEMIGKSEKLYFLEINMRNDGTGYLYTAAGVNYPLCWALYCTGKLTKEFLDSISVKTPYYLMQGNDIYNVFKGKISFYKWINQVLGAKAHFVLNLYDIKPFIYQVYSLFRQVLKKVF